MAYGKKGKGMKKGGGMKGGGYGAGNNVEGMRSKSVNQLSKKLKK